MIKVNKPPVYGYEYQISLKEFESLGDEREAMDISDLIKGEKKSVLKKSIQLAIRERWLVRNGIISYKVIDDVAKAKTIAIDDGKIDGYPSAKIRMFGYLGFPRTAEGTEDSENVVVSDSIYCALFDKNRNAIGYWKDITDFAEGGYNHKYFYLNKDEYENKISKKDLIEIEPQIKSCSIILDGKSSDESIENGAIYQAIERCSHSWGLDFMYLQPSKQEGGDIEETIRQIIGNGYTYIVIFCDKESIGKLDFLTSRPFGFTLILLNTDATMDEIDTYNNHANIHTLVVDSGKNVYNNAYVHSIDNAFNGFGFADRLQFSKSPSAGVNLSKTLNNIYESITKTDEEIYQIEIGENKCKI
jgi:hypothetical protein